MMTIRRLAKGLCPPLVVDAVRRAKGDIARFDCRVSGWADAQSKSTGYADPEILGRVLAATRQVVAGRAAFERDSILFDERTVPYSIVAVLLRSALLDRGALEVVDIGGSLGSTYRQCESFLSPVSRLRWNVVEQRSFVEAGRREFSSERLRFFESISDVPGPGTPPTYLLSSSLQYFERPQDLLRQLGSLEGRHLIIDRTPFSGNATDRLCVQHVPRSVYRASYPCWILSRQALLDALAARWRLISDHASPEGVRRTADGHSFEFRGMIFEHFA